MTKQSRIPNKFKPWIEARKKFKLSHATVQMARELGLNPRRLGAFAPSAAQPGKIPLADYIQSLYHRQFKKSKPGKVVSMETLAKEHLAKRADKKAARRTGPSAEVTIPDHGIELPVQEQSKSPVEVPEGQSNPQSELS